MPRPVVLAALIMAALPCARVDAQMDAAPIGSTLPDMSAISVPNAVGVLRYCESRQLVSTTSANEVIGVLSINPAALNSPDYAAGRNGQILPRDGKAFPIAQASAYLQSRACDLVLVQARKFH